MKILYVNALYPTETDRRAIGGAETFAIRLVRGLLAAGHDVRIVRSGTDGAGSLEHTEDGVAVHSMPCRNLYPVSDGRAHNPASRLAWHLLEDRGRIAPAFARVLEAAAPDLVHTNNLVGLTTDLWRVARQAGTPILHTLHDYYLTCPKVLRYAKGGPCVQTCLSCSLLSRRRRQAVRNIDAVVGVSQRMLDLHRAEGLFTDTPSEVILNMPQPRPASASVCERQPARKPTFGFLGRQAAEKGIFELLDAFVQLEPGSARLVVAGAIEPTVRAWVDAHAPRPDDIVFTGFTTQDAFFPAIDVAVFPSIWEEPCSMGAGEAFSFGVPSLGSRRGGIPEMLQGGRFGWLFEPGTGELAATLARLVADPAEIAAKTDFVRAQPRFTGDRLVAAYLAAYDRLARAEHPQTPA